eukprot:5929741-Pyramimonas_sp.AAC.1
MHKLLLGKGARALDFVKTTSGHLGGQSSLVKEAADTEPTAGQSALSSTGVPATNDAHAYVMPQEIQSLVNNTLKTWHRRITPYGDVTTPADQDFSLRNLQAKVYQGIYEEGSKCMPPDSMAGSQPAGVNAGAPSGADDAVEKFDIFTWSSSSAAQHGAGVRTPPSLENE